MAAVSARLTLPPENPHVALVTIDRPEAANALDPPTLRQLADAWRRVAEDDEIRCAVLTGAGERVFCSGMDLAKTIPVSQALARGERVDPDDFEGLRAVQTATLAGFDLRTPLVCAVNGHARGGGFDLMLASELRFAAPHATFALEEVALGLFPTGHAAVMLPRQIGWVQTLEKLDLLALDLCPAPPQALEIRALPRTQLHRWAFLAAPQPSHSPQRMCSRVLQIE